MGHLDHKPFAKRCFCLRCYTPTINYNPLTEYLQSFAAHPESLPDPGSEVLCLKLPYRPWFPHPPRIIITPPSPVLASHRPDNVVTTITMDILHPRRVLAVSLPGDGLASFVKGLTSTALSITGDSIAGTTHNYSITTPYYTADVPIWLDEITDPKAWSSEFLDPAAREVLDVLGAFIVCFTKPIDDAGLLAIQNLLDNVAEVVKQGCGSSWDGVCLAVGMPQSTTPFLQKDFDEWEAMCQKNGFEYVDFASQGRNEFSEPTGLERLKEALQSNDWEGGSGSGSGEVNSDEFDEDDEDDEDAEGSIDFGIDKADMKEEMAGMKRAIYGSSFCLEEEEDRDADDQDGEVEKLQEMMLKMQAVRDMGAGLPKSERGKFAAKAVSEVMKIL